MTKAEQASLERLEDKMDRGFERLSDLIEARRVEESENASKFDKRLRTVERLTYAAGVVGGGGLLFAVALANHLLNH